jgi:hypothetical protein
MEKPAVTEGFYRGLLNGILLSIPLWAIIYWIFQN